MSPTRRAWSTVRANKILIPYIAVMVTLIAFLILREAS